MKFCPFVWRLNLRLFSRFDFKSCTSPLSTCKRHQKGVMKISRKCVECSSRTSSFCASDGVMHVADANIGRWSKISLQILLGWWLNDLNEFDEEKKRRMQFCWVEKFGFEVNLMFFLSLEKLHDLIFWFYLKSLLFLDNKITAENRWKWI